MSTTPIFQALRSPLSSIIQGCRFWRAHGARVRRARWLCACADGVRLRQVRNYEERSLRLYRRAARGLQNLVAQDETSGLDWGRAAHRALKLAQAPYRVLAVGLATVAGGTALSVLAFVLVASAISPGFRAHVFPRDLAVGQPWISSSGERDYPTAGTVPSSTGSPFFFHTSHSDNPFIVIDLGAPHLIRSVVIENRTDCCRERALPLNVEIFDGTRWQLIAQRRAPFSTWSHDISPVSAQKVRVSHPGRNYLHLKRISIYGQ